MPPLVGEAAVTGTLGPEPLVLFAIIFLWTPPHFWALAMLARDDYARAGVPMLPVVATVAETTRQILGYTAALVAVSLVPVALGLLGIMYLVAALLLRGRFVQLAVRLARSGSRDDARSTFIFSLGYLALIFVAIAADLAVRGL